MGDQSVSDPSCPPPVSCPHSDQQYGATTKSSFPTEAVLGGTLGGLSVIALALIIYASFKHWSRTRRRQPTHYRRSQGHGHRKNKPLTLFGDPPLFAYDIGGLPKTLHSYAHMQPDVYIARPYVSARRQISQRQALAAMLDPRDDSSEREFCSRGNNNNLDDDDDSQYEPSIIAGSFVYHPPTNLPPHLTRGGGGSPGTHPHAHPHPHPHTHTHLHPHTHLAQLVAGVGVGGVVTGGEGGGVGGDLSYDSFKNDHLYDSNGRGVASSTLNNHHQPPDFYL